jgi:hypothetical protein
MRKGARRYRLSGGADFELIVRSCALASTVLPETDSLGAPSRGGARLRATHRQQRRLAPAHGHGFAFGLGAPALFGPRLLSTPPATPVTRLNATSPGAGSVRSNT